MSNRIPFPQYIMNMALDASTRATCDRKHVGAIIVKDNRILVTGYNGSLPDQPHCDDVGHMMEDGHCVRTVHAERNAIYQAARFGTTLEGGHIYTTASPCWECFKAIASARLKAITFAELYRDERITQFARESSIRLVHLPFPKSDDGKIQPFPST